MTAYPDVYDHLRQIAGNDFEYLMSYCFLKNLISLFTDQIIPKTESQLKDGAEFPTAEQVNSFTISSHILDAFIVEGETIIQILIC